MGISTPKPPFNLAEFLSQKGKPNTSRRNNWKRQSPTAPSESELDNEDQADSHGETVPRSESKPE